MMMSMEKVIARRIDEIEIAEDHVDARCGSGDGDGDGDRIIDFKTYTFSRFSCSSFIAVA